jgi:hypothetical protein
VIGSNFASSLAIPNYEKMEKGLTMIGAEQSIDIKNPVAHAANQAEIESGAIDSGFKPLRDAETKTSDDVTLGWGKSIKAMVEDRGGKVNTFYKSPTSYTEFAGRMESALSEKENLRITKEFKNKQLGINTEVESKKFFGTLNEESLKFGNLAYGQPGVLNQRDLYSIQTLIKTQQGGDDIKKAMADRVALSKKIRK